MDGPGHGDEISKLELYGGDFAKQLSEPADFRRHPPTAPDAKFSIPYTVALALTKGTVGLGDFSDERRSDPEIAAVAEKIEFVDDPQYNWSQALPDGAVRIHLENGETLFSEARHHDTPGAVGRPLGWSQIVSKFKDSASYAVRPLTGEPAEVFVRGVEKLETVPDVSALIELLG
jgi:2-methylcitrate dehydratase PrpD